MRGFVSLESLTVRHLWNQVASLIHCTREMRMQILSPLQIVRAKTNVDLSLKAGPSMTITCQSMLRLGLVFVQCSETPNPDYRSFLHDPDLVRTKSATKMSEGVLCQFASNYELVAFRSRSFPESERERGRRGGEGTPPPPPPPHTHKPNMHTLTDAPKQQHRLPMSRCQPQ